VLTYCRLPAPRGFGWVFVTTEEEEFFFSFLPSFFTTESGASPL